MKFGLIVNFMNSDLSITIGAKLEAMKLSNVKSGFEVVELAL